MEFISERTYIFNNDYEALIKLYDEHNSDFNLFLKLYAEYKLKLNNDVLSYYNKERNLSPQEDAFIKDVMALNDIMEIDDNASIIDLNKITPLVNIDNSTNIPKTKFKKLFGYIFMGVGFVYFVIGLILSLRQNNLLIMLDSGFDVSLKVSVDTLRFSIAGLLIFVGLNWSFLKKNIMPLGIIIIFVYVYLVTLLLNSGLYITVDSFGTVLWEHLKNVVLAFYNFVVNDAYKSIGDYYA